MIDALRARLADLRRELGARRVSIVPAGAPPPPLGVGGLRTLPLGDGARLEVEFGAIGRATEVVDRALEEAVRDLRALARGGSGWVAITETGTGPVRVRDRIRTYLHALADIHRARTAVVCRGDHPIVAARELDAHEAARLPLLVRRLAVAARAGSSHGELTDDDVYATLFWHRAALVLYFAGPYPLDFVRHRARLVARELAELMPDLDPDPGAPAMILPRP